MKPTLKKMPSFKDEDSRDTPLWRHKGRSVKILYIENYLSYIVGLDQKIYIFENLKVLP